MGYISRLSLFPEELQELQEEIDEVKIECQSSYDCFFLVLVCSFIPDDIHRLDLLSVIGRECYKDDDSDYGDDKVCESILEEEIDESCDHDPEESEKCECPNPREITLGQVSVGTHGREDECRHSKNRYNRTELIHEKYHRECQACDNSIEYKKNHSHSGIHLLDEPTEAQNETKFDEYEWHEESCIEYELHECPIIRNIECDTSGDNKSKSHPGIDSLHEAISL